MGTLAPAARLGLTRGMAGLRQIGSQQAEDLFRRPGEAPNGTEAPLHGECCSDWQPTAQHKVESNTHLRTLMSGEQLSGEVILLCLVPG